MTFQGYDASKLPDPRETAEVSRFAISKDFRRWLGEENYTELPHPQNAKPAYEKRRLAPYITFALIRGVLEGLR